MAILSKIIGAGIPAGFFLHNKTKGLRVGYGMIARGEVAFITIGIGMAHGVLSDSLYATLVFVILGTILISPPLLKKSFESKK